MGDGIRFVVIAALGACASASNSAPPRAAERPPAATAPPPAPSRVQAMLADMRKVTDKMCACADRACADAVQDETNTMARRAQANQRQDEKPTEGQLEEMQDLGTHYGECMAKAMQPADDLPAPCREYEAAIKELARCEKLPQATRDALMDSYKQTAAAWAQVPPEGRDALGVACRDAAAAIKESAAACR